ncbi:MAG: GTPase [Phycisphaerae bacterium]
MTGQLENRMISNTAGMTTSSSGLYAVRITPAGAGAIAVIAVVGSAARPCVMQLCMRAKDLAEKSMTRATLRFQGREIDDALVVCREEYHFEIHAHGGVAVVEQILAALQTAGATVRDGFENLPDHQPLHGDQTVSPAPAILMEVLAALPGLDNSFAVRLLASQHIQGLGAWAARSAARLKNSSHVDALWRVQTQARWILEKSTFFRHLITPPRIALIGRPNAGKSTLINTLAGRSASIISDLAGTTRDWVDVMIRLTAGDVSLNAIVVDTAGMRTTDDPLERESILRSHQQTLHADITVWVIDGTERDETVPTSLDEDGHSRVIYAVNKSDLGINDKHFITRDGIATVCISALTGTGVDELHEAILKALGVWNCAPQSPLIWTPRQRSLLEIIAGSPNSASVLARLAELCSGLQ